MSHSSRCPHGVKVRLANGSTVRASFKKGDRVFVLNAFGDLLRVRHRSDLPAGFNVPVAVLPPGLSQEDMARVEMLLRAGASERIDREFPGAFGGVALGARPHGRSSVGVKTTGVRTVLGEGGTGLRRPAVDELLVLAKNHRGGTSTLYESAESRLARQQELVRSLTVSDPAVLLSLVSELRAGDKLRGAALAIAVDAAVAGHPSARALLNAAMLRPDDPSVALQYFFDVYGKPVDGSVGRGVPASLRKALGDAAARLFTENSALAYDRRRSLTFAGRSQNGVTFADVIRVSHAKPSSPSQEALFTYLVGGKDLSKLDGSVRRLLPRIDATRALTGLSAEQQQAEVVSALSRARAAMGLGWNKSLVRIDGPVTALHWKTLRELAAPTDELLQARRRRVELERELAALTGEAKHLGRLERRANAQLRRAGNVEARARYQEKRAHRELQSGFGPATKRAEARLRTVELLKARAAFESDGEGREVRDARVAARRTVAVQASENAGRAALERRRVQVELKRAQLAEEKAAERPELWELAAASMGHKELVSSLAHMTGVSEVAQQWIAQRLADPAEADASGMQMVDYVTAVNGLRHAVFRRPRLSGRSVGADDVDLDAAGPSAGLVAAAERFVDALDVAAEASARVALPDLSGRRVLVLVDGSGSMWSGQVSRRADGRSDAFAGSTFADAASLFAGMLTSAGDDVEVFTYDTSATRVPSDELAGARPLAASARIASRVRGGGTDTWGVFFDTVRSDHDLVVILTDEQTSWSPFNGDELDDGVSVVRRGGFRGFGGYGPPSNVRELPSHLKVVTCNLAGDDGAHAPSHPNHVTVAGMSSLLLDGIKQAVESSGS